MSVWQWDTSWFSIALLASGLAAACAIGFSISGRAPIGRRLGWIGLRSIALALLAFCLLDPTRTVTEPIPGENRLAVAIDRSRSMQIPLPGTTSGPWAEIAEGWTSETGWRATLEADYLITAYTLGERLRAQPLGAEWPEVAPVSPLISQLQELTQRSSTTPVSGIVLLTDGVSTDPWPLSLQSLSSIPIFPVLMGPEIETPDLRVADLIALPTLFESSPLVITATLEHQGLVGRRIVVWVDDESGKRQVSQELDLPDPAPLVVRLEVPQFSGAIGRYRVGVRLADETAEVPLPPLNSTQILEPIDSASTAPIPETAERTLVNNYRQIVVPRPVGPYRILYVGGRPNWEFKFLRRAAQEDPEVELVGLLRMADREPRFAFMEQGVARNRFFDGFRDADEELDSEQDEPVLVRIGTRSPEELASGFPRTEAELFEYGAIVIDDVEAGFFDQEQIELLRTFVERRGGGLLLLGGPQAFSEGDWSDTSLAELSPVYVERRSEINDQQQVQWEPTREGWLTPWARLREEEASERQVRAALPSLLGVNRVGGPKPAATVLALAGPNAPLLVAQEFGRGRTAALTASDLHRWQLLAKRDATLSNQQGLGDLLPDFGRQWRQMLRWLVSDLPRRVALSSTEVNESGSSHQVLTVSVLTDGYRPDDEALVSVSITDPHGAVESLPARPTAVAGEYQVEVPMFYEGEYLVVAEAEGLEAAEIGTATHAWIWEPSQRELRSTVVDVKRWEELASKSGGRVLRMSDLANTDWLDPTRLPHVVTRQQSVWNRWPILLAALLLLVTEWGWRRLKGGA